MASCPPSPAAFAIWIVCVVVVVTMALAPGAMATNHVVGGYLGWYVSHVKGNPTFYQDWANSHRPYHLHDTLEFRFTPGGVVLLLHDAAGFHICNATRTYGSISGGHMILPLQPPYMHPGRVYFISGDQVNCDVGLKFYIDVLA